MNEYNYLVLGSNGYLGSNICKCLNTQNKTYLPVNTRLNNIDELTNQIKNSKCKYVLCAAGISGNPSILIWAETHEKEVLDLYSDILNLMKLCELLKVHLTIFGSGLGFDGKKEIYTEDDIPNLNSKVYMKFCNEIQKNVGSYSNVLYLRLFYSCTFDGHPKCFYSKTKLRAHNIHDVTVSLTIIPNLFKYIPKIIESGKVGILNFSNNGKISLLKILELNNIDFTINNNDIQHSNNYELSTKLLESIVNEKIKNVEEIIIDIFKYSQ
jgi:dTDP-4-dehydrorhamnose reductase